jgi:hypothetical protein
MDVALVGLAFVLIAMLACVLGALIIERRTANVNAEKAMAELAVDTMRITRLEHRINEIERKARDRPKPVMPPVKKSKAKNAPRRKRRYRRKNGRW